MSWQAFDERFDDASPDSLDVYMDSVETFARTHSKTCGRGFHGHVCGGPVRRIGGVQMLPMAMTCATCGATHPMVVPEDDVLCELATGVKQRVS